MNELEIIRHGRIEGMSIFFDTVDYRTPHFHPEWELIWVRDEALSVSCGKHEFIAEKDELLLFSPNQTHEFHKVDRSCTFLCLQVSPKLLKGSRNITADSLFPRESLSIEEYASVRCMILDIMGAYLEQKAHFELKCIGETCIIFHTLFSRMPCHTVSKDEQESIDKRNRRLTALIKYVDENYMHKIRLSDFAEAEGCSLSYMSHFVKDALNQSFQDYVCFVRVNSARRLIAAGNEKMLDVCVESGFSDYRYFSKAFRQQFGMTPEEYRKTMVRPQNGTVHHSLHSLERFYSDEQSKQMLAGLSV